jgi:hypothetical protein
MASNLDFISGLGDLMSQQFESGDNKVKSLDLMQNGTTTRDGLLGDFAKQVDQTAERSYTELGSYRNDFYNPKVSQQDVLMNSPEITVLVKKRAFNSLAENYRPDKMDKNEAMFLRATKILFQNKCKQISAIEKLSKIAKVSSEIGQVDYHLLPIIFSLTDTIFDLPSAVGGVLGGDGNLSNSVLTSAQQSLTGFKNVVDRVREVIAFSKGTDSTTWLTNVPDSFRSSFGEGTGVIELTNVSSLKTTTSCKTFAAGNFNLTIDDPYNLMRITNLDIEQAISDSINKYYANSYLQLGITSLDQIISDKKNELNTMRSSRGADPVMFIVEPDTFLGKRVRAIIDNVGFEIQFSANFLSNINDTGANQNPIDPSALQGSTQIGSDGLSPDEATVFNDIVSSLYTQLSLMVNSRKQANFSNQDPGTNLNLLRKKLRLHYGNKLIIQPMDNVHIYISSQKQQDTKITGGLQSNFNGLGFMQGLNNLVGDIRDTFNIAKGYSLEKSVYVGNDFPNWLWMALRNQFVSQADGAHVFAGVVETASMNYSDGNYVVSVGGKDNAAFFEYGIVNFKPSVDVFNGSLYDPMTPFKIQFDSANGSIKLPVEQQTFDLLDENTNLFTSAFIKDKNGAMVGSQSSENQFLTQDADRFKSASMAKVFYDPEGMIYRWKEGIGTLEQFGDTVETNPIVSPGVATTTDPFAGQNMMDVLSLLITGIPYNFATFYKAAIQFDNFKLDPITKEPPAKSYFRGLQQGLKYRNLIYGNFIPFKGLVMDDATFAQILNNQLNVSAYDQDLQNLLSQRSSLADKISFINQSGTPGSQQDNQYLATIDTQIQDRISSIGTELTKINQPINIIGNDITVDYDPSGLQDSSKNRLDNNSQRDLRKKVALLTKRLAWKVRANEDVNLLIIDDTYDKDYDIQNFEKAFVNNFSIFQSEYLTVSEKINSVVQALRGFEIFCNTQGHIEIRNQKFNRVPSSVFYRMLRMKNELGIQIYPQFLEDLCLDQLTLLFSQIEVLEDEIRLYCLALGNIDDAQCVNFIKSTQAAGLVLSNSTNSAFFQFLSDQNTGKMLNTPAELLILASPDKAIASIPKLLTNINSQSNVSAFDIVSRAKLVQSVVSAIPSPNSQDQFKDLQSILSKAGGQTRQKTITDRLRSKTAQTFDPIQIFGKSQGGNPVTKVASSVEVLDILNNVASRLGERQTAIKQAADALKNVQEATDLFKGNAGSGATNTTNKMLFPSLFGNKNIPQVFEHMIEDESFDDLGPGSSGRFTIKNHDIINYTIEENRPPFTSIDVTGRVGDLYIANSDLPQDLNIGKQGNIMTTVSAVDYDLWRMYGISVPTPIDAPYLQDPESQCAPYAVSLLNQARKQILGGSMTLVGNEYQQPGEVIYLENNDLLFYVESVSHNFTYGQGYTTDISLTYGHNPGEYIPTMFDVIGKMLYNNKNISQHVHKKQDTTTNQEHVGTIVGNINVSGGFVSSSPSDDIIKGMYGGANRTTIQQIIDYAAPTLNMASDNMLPVLEIRVFYNSANSNFTQPSEYATALANALLDYLTGKVSLDGSTNAVGNTKQSNTDLSAFTLTQQVIVVAVDSNPSNVGEFRYPSGKAYYVGRDAINKSSSNMGSKNVQSQIDGVIYNYTVDCWIYTNNITPKPNS